MENQTSRYKAIIDGWRNLIFKDEAIELIAKARAKICSTCANNRHNICTLCGCPLIAKTRTELSKCPKDKWTN